MRRGWEADVSQRPLDQSVARMRILSGRLKAERGILQVVDDKGLPKTSQDVRFSQGSSSSNPLPSDQIARAVAWISA